MSAWHIEQARSYGSHVLELDVLDLDPPTLDSLPAPALAELEEADLVVGRDGVVLKDRYGVV